MKTQKNANFHRIITWLGLFGIIACLLCINNTLKEGQSLHITGGNTEQISPVLLIQRDTVTIEGRKGFITSLQVGDCEPEITIRWCDEIPGPCETGKDIILPTKEKENVRTIVKKSSTLKEDVEENLVTKKEGSKEGIAKGVTKESEDIEDEDGVVVASTKVESIDQIIELSTSINKIVENKHTRLLTDTSTIHIGEKGFDKEHLSERYTYLDENQLETQLDIKLRFYNEKASFEMLETKEGFEPRLVFSQEARINNKGTQGLDSLSLLFLHDHLESIPEVYDTWDRGIKEIVIGGGTLLGAFASQVVLRFQPDIVYQDFNNQGKFHDDNPKLAYNLDEKRRDRLHDVWQGANYVGAAVGALFIAQGVRDILRDEDVKKDKWVIVPVSISTESGFAKPVGGLSAKLKF